MATTAYFNTEITVQYPYYSKEAEIYTQTYNLDSVITCSSPGPYSYALISTTDVRIEGNVLFIGPSCYGELTIEVKDSEDVKSVATTNITGGYADFNSRLVEYKKQFDYLRENWSTFINNKTGNI